MKQYELFELSWQGPVLSDNYAAIDLQAVFTLDAKASGSDTAADGSAAGKSTGTSAVKGFYDGDGIYKLRFLPMQAGLWRWKVSGVITDEGEAMCAPADSHGPVRAEGTHFIHADGTPFHPFGTTVYALISQSDELIEQTMQTLEAAPFNKIRMCIFPKHYDYNHNEPTWYAFEKAADDSWDPSRPCVPFWQALDRHIERLCRMGIQIDLILFHPYDRWGFNGMGREKDLMYLDYLLRRLSAYPHIWWSLANEYELCKRTEEDWFEIEAFVSENDPYHHLLSCHNIFKLWDATRPLTTHASIQSKSFHRLGDWLSRYQKPVMLDECCYEGNIEHFWGCITGKEMTHRFWRCVTSGAYCTHGETFYSDDEILWWARGGVLKGESAPRIAFCREIIESLPGYLEKEGTFYDRLLGLSKMSKEQQDAALSHLDTTIQHMIRAFIDSGENLQDARAAECTWYGHIGEDVFLHYYDTRPIARETLRLPEDKTYRLELLDTWNMTRTTLATGVSGEYVVSLPGKEDMALLITREA